MSYWESLKACLLQAGFLVSRFKFEEFEEFEGFKEFLVSCFLFQVSSFKIEEFEEFLVSCFLFLVSGLRSLKSLGFGLCYLGFGIWNLGFGIWNLGFGIWVLVFEEFEEYPIITPFPNP